MIAAILSLGVVSFVIACGVTWAMKRISPRLDFVDKPGHRKIHRKPIPLGGGVAIFLGFAVPMAIAVAACGFATAPPGTLHAAYIGGVRQQTPMALAMLGAMLLTHVLGLWDDRKAMGPFSKLLLQLLIVAALVIPFKPLWALSAFDDFLHAHGVVSIAISILWIAGITNAFNFLDNMDGLSAGVAAVCTTAFLVATLSISQWFVAACLALLLGACWGSSALISRRQASSWATAAVWSSGWCWEF